MRIPVLFNEDRPRPVNIGTHGKHNHNHTEERVIHLDGEAVTLPLPKRSRHERKEQQRQEFRQQEEWIHNHPVLSNRVLVVDYIPPR